MLALQKVLLFSLLALLVPQTQTSPKQELNDQLYEAVRKGDTAAVTAALDHGADDVLISGVQGNKEEVVKMALDSGKIKPEALTAALAFSMNANTAPITE